MPPKKIPQRHIPPPVIEELQRLEQDEKQLQDAIDLLNRRRSETLRCLYAADAACSSSVAATPRTPGRYFSRHQKLTLKLSASEPQTPPKTPRRPNNTATPKTPKTPKTPSSGHLRRFSRSWASADQSPTSIRGPPTKDHLIAAREDGNSKEVIPSVKKKASSTPKKSDLKLNPGSYTTIVLRSDGVWVELRCPICKGNASPIDGAFLKGVPGFWSHLLRVHAVSLGRNSSHKALRMCTYREVRDCEVRKMSRHLFAINTVRCWVRNQAVKHDFRTRARVAQDRIPLVGKLEKSKLTRKRFDVARHMPPKAADREALQRAALSTEGNQTAQQQDTSMGGTDSSLLIEKFDDDKPQDVDFSAYCPCTLSGHACKASRCTKLKLCLSTIHTAECMATFSHAVDPSCVTLVLDGICPDGDQCLFGHECAAWRADIFIWHSHHEH